MTSSNNNDLKQNTLFKENKLYNSTMQSPGENIIRVGKYNITLWTPSKKYIDAKKNHVEEKLSIHCIGLLINHGNLNNIILGYYNVKSANVLIGHLPFSRMPDKES